MFATFIRYTVNIQFFELWLSFSNLVFHKIARNAFFCLKNRPDIKSITNSF